MRSSTTSPVAVSILCGLLLVAPASYLEATQERSSADSSAPAISELEVVIPGSMQPIPIPADPELEEQIKEIQEALGGIYQQMVRRKEAIQKTADSAAKARLYEEFERLRKDRDELERLLHDLIDEAKKSERTAIDEALARARWLERQQEYQQQKEEIIRDRQE